MVSVCPSHGHCCHYKELVQIQRGSWQNAPRSTSAQSCGLRPWYLNIIERPRELGIVWLVSTDIYDIRVQMEKFNTINSFKVATSPLHFIISSTFYENHCFPKQRETTAQSGIALNCAVLYSSGQEFNWILTSLVPGHVVTLWRGGEVKSASVSVPL